MKTKKKLIRKLVALTILTLTLLCLSCMTTQATTEYVVPEIDFPTFPILTGAYGINEVETVVPNSWLFKLAEYKIRIDETEKNYKTVKQICEEAK